MTDSVLDDTLKKLGDLYPAVASVGVVPVGLTGHRQKLAHLTPVDQRSVPGAIIDQIDAGGEAGLGATGLSAGLCCR
jgi:hypothetical protein